MKGSSGWFWRYGVFGHNKIRRREFCRLRAASSFAHGGKETKMPPGTAHPETIFHFRRGGTLGRPPGGRLRSHPHLSRLRRASLPLLAFGHFPLTGGIGLSPCRGKAFGRVLDPPLRRIWERPRYSRKGRSQTGPRAHTVRPYDGKRTTHQDRSPHPSGLRPHLPLKGKATGDRKGRPYGENAPRALAEKTQAPLWNRTRP